MRKNRVALACLIALSFFLAPASKSWAGTQRDDICQGCGDGPGCTPCSSSDGSSSFSSNPGIAWGGMTKRNMEMVGRDCAGKPLCFLVQGTIGLLGGAITDVPYYAVKGVGYGLYYGGKGLYYGARGLGTGLAYTGRSIGRGIAYPFNRPPKPTLPPTTWEQYKRDVLKHQKALTKANKANKANQRWCISRIPLEVSAGRSEWEARCNPGDAVSRAALPKAVIAGAMVAVTATSPAPTAVHVLPSVAQTAIAPALAIIPALQDPTKALGENAPQAKTAGASGFDDSGPMAGKPASVPNAASGFAVGAQPTFPEPESTTAAASTFPDEIPASAEPALQTEAPPTPVAAAAPPEGVPADKKSTPAPSHTTTPSTVAGSPAATHPVPLTPAIPLRTPIPSVPPMVSPAAPTPTTTVAPPASPSFVVPKFVMIEGDKEFKRKTARDLEFISKTKTGAALFKSLADSGRKLKIIPDGGAGNGASAVAPGAGILKADGTSGPKADTEILYSTTRADLIHLGAPYSDPDVKWAQAPNRPPHVGLFHEMVHADDMMHGKFDTSLTKNAAKRVGKPVIAGEMRAVGLDGKKHDFDENSYRRELKLPERDFY